MKSPSKSLFVFGIYMIAIVGLGFTIMPAFVLDSFNLSYGDDTWIRFVGLLAIIIGVYYVVAARYEFKEFFIWTVWMRFFAAAFMILMIITGITELPVLLFASIEIAGATWTLFAIKSTYKVNLT